MEINLLDMKDRLIVYIEGKPLDNGIFDINNMDKTTNYSISAEYSVKLGIDILFEIKDKYKQDRVFNSDQDIRDTVEEIIRENNLCPDEPNIESVIGSVTTMIKHSVPYVYKARDYKCDDNDVETISYNSEDSCYLEIEHIYMYKVENRSIYLYDSSNHQYIKIATYNNLINI